MRVGSQPLPITARIERAPTRSVQRQVAAMAPREALLRVDRVEISVEASRAAAAQSLETATAGTREQIRDLVGRANREAARNAGTADVDRLRQLVGQASP